MEAPLPLPVAAWRLEGESADAMWNVDEEEEEAVVVVEAAIAWLDEDGDSR